MDQTGSIKFKPDSLDLLNIIIKYWKVLLITSVVVIVISAGISLLIKPLFRSTVVLYPTTNVIETQSVFGLQGSATELFGDETATEKVLQILKSDNIRKFIVERYDLMNHYGISPKAKYKYTMLDMRMKKYIVSRKTQYSSVEINVLDRDPVLAAEIANDISRRIDTVFNQIVREAGKKESVALASSYNNQLAKVKSLEDSLHIIMPGGSISTAPDIRAGSSGNSWASVAGRYTPEFLRLYNMFEAENESLSIIRNKLTEARMTAEQNLPYTHIINEARVAEKKALPKRSLIVIASLISSILLVTFFLFSREMIVRNE